MRYAKEMQTRALESRARKARDRSEAEDLLNPVRPATLESVSLRDDAVFDDQTYRSLGGFMIVGDDTEAVVGGDS